MKKIISITVTVFFLLILVTDLHYKFLKREAIESFKFTLVSKATIGLILTVFVVMLNPIKKHIKSYTVLISLIICVGISNYFSYKSGADINQAIYIQAQYLFGIIVMFFFLNNFNFLDFNYLEKVVMAFIIINFTCILIGYFYDYNLFKTYMTRFGYNGIFKSTSEASYFYMFTFILYLNKKQSVKQHFLLALIIVSSLMVGSKTLYFYLFVSFIYMLVLFLTRRVNLKPAALFSIISGMFIISGFVIMKFILPLNYRLYALYQEDGFITLFFSLRDKLLLNAIEIIEQHYSLINYLFGGMAFVPKTTELGIVDLFITFGVIGIIIYFYFLKLNFPKLNNSNVKVLGTIILASIVLRGNFFYFPSVIFLSLAIFALILNQSKKKLIPTGYESNCI